MKFNKLFLAFAGAVLMASCSSDDDSTSEAPSGQYENGFFVLNQGNYGAANSNISFISNDLLTKENNIFSSINPTITMGDTGQDVGFYEDFAFIVLNGSNSIQVVNRFTFEHVATISSGLNNPRYIAFANGKGYVTNWGNATNPADDFVAVLDLASYSVISSISVVEGPERIIEENNKLYVAHHGGYGYGNSVSVIALPSNTVTSILVGDVPNSLEIENGVLYVLCSGKEAWSGAESNGSLKQIDLGSNAVVSYNFPLGEHPSNLVIENNKIFYTVNSNIYTKGLQEALPTTPLFSTTAQGVYGVYCFAIGDDQVYVGDAMDYNSNGKIYIYSMNGSLVKEHTVGVIPAGIYFNE